MKLIEASSKVNSDFPDRCDAAADRKPRRAAADKIMSVQGSKENGVE